MLIPWKNSPYFLDRALGRPARALLDQMSQGTVVGLTSRGAFLCLEPFGEVDAGREARTWLVFLSEEVFLGPLTANLDPADLAGLSLAQGDTFSVCGETIHFCRAAAGLRIGDATLWSAPTRPPDLLPVAERQALFQQVSRRISAERDLPDFDLSAGLGALSGAKSKRLHRRCYRGI